MNEKISKLKAELSKLSGVNFHNPKYREVFKRYFDEKSEDEDDKAEAAKAKDAAADEAVATKAEETIEDITEDDGDEWEEEQSDETDADETELEKAIDEDKKTDGDVEKTEPKSKAVPKPELNAEEKALRELIGEPESEPEEESSEESKPEIKTEAESQPAINLNDRLLETELELELVKAGIRKDRIEVAKRLFLPELKAGKAIEEVGELIAQFPEWIGKKGGAQGFGMPLGDKTNVLTAEEKALKAMGINPRD